MEKLPHPLLCSIYTCWATSRIQLQLPAPEQRITHWGSTAIKEKTSKDVLSGKAAQIPGAGDVYVCSSSMLTPAMALKALALIWKWHVCSICSWKNSFCSQILAMPYLMRKILQKPQHHVFSRLNPQHAQFELHRRWAPSGAQPHTHLSAQLPCKAAHCRAPSTHHQQKHLFPGPFL